MSLCQSHNQFSAPSFIPVLMNANSDRCAIPSRAHHTRWYGTNTPRYCIHARRDSAMWGSRPRLQLGAPRSHGIRDTRYKHIALRPAQPGPETSIRVTDPWQYGQLRTIPAPVPWRNGYINQLLRLCNFGDHGYWRFTNPGAPAKTIVSSDEPLSVFTVLRYRFMFDN